MASSLRHLRPPQPPLSHAPPSAGAFQGMWALFRQRLPRSETRPQNHLTICDTLEVNPHSAPQSRGRVLTHTLWTTTVTQLEGLFLPGPSRRPILRLTLLDHTYTGTLLCAAPDGAGVRPCWLPLVEDNPGSAPDTDPTSTPHLSLTRTLRMSLKSAMTPREAPQAWPSSRSWTQAHRRRRRRPEGMHRGVTTAAHPSMRASTPSPLHASSTLSGLVRMLKRPGRKTSTLSLSHRCYRAPG